MLSAQDLMEQAAAKGPDVPQRYDDLPAPKDLVKVR